MKGIGKLFLYFLCNNKISIGEQAINYNELYKLKLYQNPSTNTNDTKVYI